MLVLLERFYRVSLPVFTWMKAVNGLEKSDSLRYAYISSIGFTKSRGLYRLYKLKSRELYRFYKVTRIL